MADVIALIKKQYMEFAKKQWPPYHGKMCYVKVDIVEVKKRVGQSKYYSIIHHLITCTDLFKVKSCDKQLGRKVLVEGYGGTGKTVLCTSLCADWACGALLQEFNLVLFLPLYHTQVISAGSLPNLLKLLFPIAQERKTIRRILREEGDKVLIVADGWNQLHKNKSQDGSFLHQLLFGQLLSQVSVLVTSRPSASAPLHSLQCIDQFIEIHGFSECSIRQYINYVLASDKACRLLNHLQHNKPAEVLCSVPLNCAILCHLWYSLDTEIVPTTMTELYTVFISNMIICVVKKSHPHNHNVHLCFTALPDGIQECFMHWCEFAFQAIGKEGTIFSQCDVANHFPQCSDEIRSCFGLLQHTELPFEVLNKQVLQFLHPVIMEYLAALYLSQQEMDTQLEMCKSHANLIADYDNVWKFYFGLIKQSQSEEADFGMIEILSHVISHKLFLCHYAYEAGSNLVNLVTDSIISGQFSFSSVHPHTVYDCSAVAHVLAHIEVCSDIQISFSDCDLTDAHLTQLTGKLGSKLQKHKVTKLDLHGNQLTFTCMFKIFHEVLPSHHLVHLNLSHNFMGVEGLQILEDVVRENGLKNLQDLILQSCLTDDSDVNGALLTTFSDAIFTHCNQLRHLDLSRNRLSLPGAQALEQTSTVSQPHLTLTLNSTELGDEGLRALARGNWHLHKLELQRNFIHAIGVLSLAESITSGRCKVSCVFLDDNPLGLEGSRAIGKIMCGCNSSELSVISMSRCHLTDVEDAIDAHSTVIDIAQELFQAHQNDTIAEIYVDENDFAGECIHILAGFLFLCPKVQYIYSSNCDISSTEVERLVHILPSLQLGWSKLKLWQLEHNMIDDNAVQYLAILIHKMSTCLDNNLITDKMAKKIWKVSH